jgi:hypothetical protein
MTNEASRTPAMPAGIVIIRMLDSVKFASLAVTRASIAAIAAATGDAVSPSPDAIVETDSGRSGRILASYEVA